METARLERCTTCDTVFLVCDPCGFNWRYCEACAPVARQASVRRARRLYRQSPEGREQHRDEEQRRRDRRRGRVGDQFVQGDGAGARVVGMQAAEPSLMLQAPPTCAPGLVAQPQAPPAIGSTSPRLEVRPAESPGPAQWRVLVRRELAEVAVWLCGQGAVLACVGCGRRGRIAEVVLWGESPWRRAARHACQRRRQGDDGA